MSELSIELKTYKKGCRQTDMSGVSKDVTSVSSKNNNDIFPGTKFYGAVHKKKVVAALKHMQELILYSQILLSQTKF